MEATIWGLGFWIGLRVEGSGFRRWGLEFMVWHVGVYCPEPGPWQVLGGPWDLVTTYNWTYNPTYNFPKWAYRGYPNYK